MPATALIPFYDPRLIPWAAGNEGFVSRYYKCPAGAGTIGYGFTWTCKPFRDWWLKKYGRKFGPGDVISKEDALPLLRAAIDRQYGLRIRAKVLKAGTRVTPHAAAAAIDMAFNCGTGSLRWSWFKLLLEGRIREAAARFKVTGVTANGRRLPGLVRRRAEGASIMAGNIWPDWVKVPRSPVVADIAAALPRWQIRAEDFWQGVDWLAALKFLEPAERKDANAIRSAILTFQKGHPQLDNDGILGRATLDQLQRVIDLKRQAKGTAGAGSAGASAGVAGIAAEAPGWGGAIVVCSLAAALIVLGFLIWRYRDELAIALNTLGRRL